MEVVAIYSRGFGFAGSILTQAILTLVYEWLQLCDLILFLFIFVSACSPYEGVV